MGGRSVLGAAARAAGTDTLNMHLFAKLIRIESLLLAWFTSGNIPISRREKHFAGKKLALLITAQGNSQGMVTGRVVLGAAARAASAALRVQTAATLGRGPISRRCSQGARLSS